MQMKDFTYFGYNDTRRYCGDAIKNKESIDPLFLDLVKSGQNKKLFNFFSNPLL